MNLIRRNFKRVATDTAGYGLLILAALTGWLPGPGGIPLALAGLGLLSINNVWARRLRNYLLRNGGKVVTLAFPPNPVVQWLYDVVVVFAWLFVIWLLLHHAAFWQISFAIALFFAGVAIALLNRDRYNRIKHRRPRKA